MAGQSGKSLEFEIDGTPTVGFQADVKAAIDALLAPVTPKYTAGALAQKIVQNLPVLNNNQSAYVLVDQADGSISIKLTPDASLALDIFDNSYADADRGLVVSFNMDEIVVTAPSGDTSLPFEGGAV